MWCQQRAACPLQGQHMAELRQINNVVEALRQERESAERERQRQLALKDKVPMH